MTVNKIIALISYSLGEDSHSFSSDSSRAEKLVSFVYRESKFVSDDFLNIKEYSEYKVNYIDSVSSRLMTKLLYSDHKEEINAEFEK